MSGRAWGNLNHSKNWSSDLRRKAFFSYMDHIADGYCLDSWHYSDDKGNFLSYKAMQTWMKDNPEEFPPEYLQQAKSIAKRDWETEVYDSAKGRNKDANTASLQMVMRNKFGWDKQEEGKKEVNPEVMQKFTDVMDLLSKKQSETP